MSADKEFVAIGDLSPDDATAAARLATRALRDDPMYVAVYGRDPRRRERGLYVLNYSALVLGHAPHLCARQRGRLVGVLGLALPGTPYPTLRALRPALLPFLRDLRSFARLSWQLNVWALHAPKEPYWHLSPVAVAPGLQGQGIGSRMMEVLCSRLDASGESAYLETDKPENVAFYERFGFVVRDKAPVLGAATVFMYRTSTARTNEAGVP